MSSGSAQDVAVEHFLRDIERRSKRLHCAVIGCEAERPCGDMNLLYRKSRLDWRQRDQDASRKSDPSATVGKVRDLASFRRHFRMGFMTMPASQDLSPHSCASAMAPRSQSCHAVGAGDASLENGDCSDSQSQHGGRCPPVKPKRHPSTRLSSSSAPEGAAPPPSSSHAQAKHSEKKNAMKKSDSGELASKKLPPLKPKRSPSTQLSFDPLPPRVPHSAASLPFQGADSQIQSGDGDDEPVYIEMVGQVFTRESQTATPHPVTPVATTPDSDSDQSEAIYEEMKYPLQENRESQRHLPAKQERMKTSKHYHVTPSPSSSSSSLPRPASSSPSYSKPKTSVSMSHSSPLPSSASSTPVPQVLSSSPHTPRAPTPYLLQGSKCEPEPNTKIPAPFPNLLQHRPPLLAFPQPAAASSGVGVQSKASASSKTGTAQAGTSSSGGSNVPTSGSKEPSGESVTPQEKHSRDSQLGPAPGLRARSHSTPLPPSSKSTSPFSHHHHHHHHHHPHHRPSHYHHYRKPERGDSPAPLKGSSQASAQATVQTQTLATGKEGKSVSFLLKTDKGEKDKDRDKERGRERDRDRDSGPHSLQLDLFPATSSQGNSGSTPTPQSASSHRPHSRPHLRSHTPHGLPAYRPPSSDSPLLWTYPSGGFRRPPAYESLRGSSQTPSSGTSGVGEAGSKGGEGSSSLQSKVGFVPWDSDSGFAADEGSSWPPQRKLSFSHGSRETEKEEGRSWNGSADALLRMDKEELGAGLRGCPSGIPAHYGAAASRTLAHCAGAEGGPGFRAPPRSGMPLPCQTFPACRNGVSTAQSGGFVAEVGRLGRSSSAAGGRPAGGGDVQRQSSLPAREALNQPQGLAQTQASCGPGGPGGPGSPGVSRQQHLQLHQQQLQLKQQLQQQHHLQLQFQQLAQLAQGQPAAGSGAASSATQTQRDGKLLEVIERKRCLCKEIKAHRRPDKSLCKQDSMPILPSWRRTPEPRKTGTPPCQRPQAVVWDTAI
ncbi:neuronal tyrosine-phosphorylated phosphoinositide-3-kinase adapter 1 isoform X2 [Syngnathoides biaculeatus]|uniref:neuronal tyrosine-phosphorylated phosphoinositide-3-kinase adapter 1 isoform X2 n=1 Tax=Syngnathoides biaculeatus TaxID=300417 RepID=UPI002ADDF2B3|nr:neuronal tyrosine-phosphorylated phosphoinositide-3-kinase adapter 1 isoform X2 [Syngnathoides biaculeatus]